MEKMSELFWREVGTREQNLSIKNMIMWILMLDYYIASRPRVPKDIQNFI